VKNSNLKMNQSGIDIIKDREKLYLKAYLCPSGIPTIGWGHTLKVKLGMTCTIEQAEEWLKIDIEDFEKAIYNTVNVDLNENQFSALVSFVFNIGYGAFVNSTLLRLLNLGNYESVPEQLRRWKYGSVRGVKTELPGLVIRRNMEAELWSKPIGS